MKPFVDVDEIIERFTLLLPDINFLGRNDPHNHLGKALLLQFFQSEGRFPESETEFTPAIIEYVAQQLRLPPEVIKEYNWDGRTISDQRNQIRELLSFHPVTMLDQEALRSWLIEEALPHEHRHVHLEQLAYQHLQKQHIEPPTKRQIERLITSALHQYEQSFFDATAACLSEETKEQLQQLIYKKEELATQTDLGEMVDDDPKHYLLHVLKSGPGDAKIANLKKVADRLKWLQQIGLPDDLFSDVPLRFLRQYQQQVAVESISHLQRQRRIEELQERLAPGDTLIVTELSRLGRSTGDVILLINQLVSFGVAVTIIKQNLHLNKDSQNVTAKVMVTLLALFAEIERDFISLSTKETLAAKKAAGVILGKPKGAIQKSMYDKDRARIAELLQHGVPQKRIIEMHLGYGTTKSLSYYIRTRRLTPEPADPKRRFP